jgi:hypothetical protein
MGGERDVPVLCYAVRRTYDRAATETDRGREG